MMSTSLLACTGDETPAFDPNCDGGKCDTLTGDERRLDSPCKAVLGDKSGRGFLPERLAEDALIKHVYMNKNDGCPVTAAEILAVLDKNDKKSCKGVKTSVISEQAQLNGTADGAGYRTITTRVCDGRAQFGLIFSMFGFDPASDELPDGVEVIAFDDKNKVFNYYKEVGGKMLFFGSSTDYVTKGAGGPNLTDTRGCANCHTGGGLLMKELTNPWLHWEEIPSAGFTTFSRRSPGARELLENRPMLGTAADGPRLELEVVEPGNKAWNARRIAFVNGNGTVADVLRPLFCPVDVNIAATFNKRRVNHNFLVDPSLLDSLGLDDAGRINTTEATYDAMLAVTGSNVSGSDKADVNLAFAFVGRSHSDIDYVEQLIAAKIIDRGFADDVLMVDFTRQAFSDDRCDLLELAPTLTTAKRTPAAIRDGFLAKLANAADGTAAAQLRTNLQARKDGDALDHKSTVEDFLAACNSRQTSDKFVAPSGSGTKFNSLVGQSAFHIDALKLRSLIRKTVMTDGVLDNARGSAQHAFTVFEFDDTLPADDIAVTTSAVAGNPLQVHPDARLSPVDCKLVKDFVAAGAPGGNASACPGQCGDFVNGAACQCDDGCAQFGNCCDGFEPLLTACPGAPFEFVNGAACQCDADCAQFGNCCAGWETVCLPN